MFGEEGWEKLGKWPRQAWQAYLDWYREALDLPVRNDANVTRFEMDGDFLRLTVNDSESVIARKVILATGIEGMGNWYVPPFIREKLPQSVWTMCTDDVDSLAWKGQRIAVLGAGRDGLGPGGRSPRTRRGGCDHLHAPAADPDVERLSIPGKRRGYLRHYQSMSDADKWRWIQTIFTYGQPPTQDGVDRCAAFETFCIHPGATWTDVALTPDGVAVTASDGSVETFDHLFIGCGFSIDPANRPELAPFADNITKWSDVYTPPDAHPDPWLITYPYLTRDLRFVEKVPARRRC